MIPIAKPFIEEEEKKAVIEVLDSGNIVQGEKVAEFEKNIANYCGTKYAIATNNGTSSIHTALYALGIKSGDEVITSPFTFVASANPIIMQGAKPVFVDIKEDTFNIDPSKIRDKITAKTKAIIVVDLYGQIHDTKEIREIANEYNLKIIEDACQAIGAEFNGKKAGTFGDLSCFSFYATKNMITGEGGMITTNNEEYVELCKRFRHHGQSEKTRYEYYDLGYNYRMTDIQAAIGIEQLKKIDLLTQKRINNAKMLTEGLYKISQIKIPYIKPRAKHVFHQYTIKTEKRDQLRNYLKENGVGCGTYYPKPLHLHPFFMKLGYKEGDFPIAERVSKEVLSLPVHPSLTQEEIDRIIKTMGDFYA
ncbi:MAG: DegT/DnrJ/EryC1/StrS family aminotransferase [Nanoarchaeota archaeon]|nr:DegT/DnrJ/EryC1/StrS family aminotransferase [Nanoarchaeota archaeon]